jgi:alkylhydroperoxidase/carboxymuconolactone decarboxylase family protein YurZ
MQPTVYPLSKQETFVSNLERLREVSPELATAFRSVRVAADGAGPLDHLQRELCLLAGFAATRNEGGFRVHCTRAIDAGASLAHIQQVVMLMLGTNLGLAPVVEALQWAWDELGNGVEPTST